MGRPVLNLLRLARMPIYTQLHLEEALLRATKDNWLIVNDGAFNPAIVIGISGRPHELLHVSAARAAGVQVLRRFTGGGTVVVDSDTLFATLIMKADSVPGVDPYPAPIMRLTERLYAPAFAAAGCSDFRLRENDYVVGGGECQSAGASGGGGRKIGGNAQAITGRRWLHHTSFLWDYRQERMALLKHPPKAPQYRAGRPHEDFVVRLVDVMGRTAGQGQGAPTGSRSAPGPGPGPEGAVDDEALLGRRRQALVHQLAVAPGAVLGFDVREVSLAEAATALQRQPHLGTRMVDLQQLDPGQ